MNVQDIFIAPAEINTAANNSSSRQVAESDSFDDYIDSTDSAEVRNDSLSESKRANEENPSDQKLADERSNANDYDSSASEGGSAYR